MNEKSKISEKPNNKLISVMNWPAQDTVHTGIECKATELTKKW